MGKRIIPQRRGRGTTTYRSPSHRYHAPVSYPSINNSESTAIVRDIIHHPGRTAPNAIIESDGVVNYIMAPEGMKVNDTITLSQKKKDYSAGDLVTLSDIPEGTSIYGIEKLPGSGPSFCRTGGSMAKLIGKQKDKIVVQLPSKKQKAFDPRCRASIGVIAGGGRLEKPMTKAGNKYFAKKAKNKLWPKVSGTSMNAVDHPFGGSSSAHHGKHSEARKNAPAGAKVGKIRPRRTGRR
jgi:large subunit ribosomal protein L2